MHSMQLVEADSPKWCQRVNIWETFPVSLPRRSGEPGLQNLSTTISEFLDKEQMINIGKKLFL